VSCHRLLPSITDTRTVVDGTDTKPKIDLPRLPSSIAGCTEEKVD
jgi:hypothetical protein